MPAHPIPRSLRGGRGALLLGCALLPALLWWVRGRALGGFYLADDFAFLRAGAMGSSLPTLDAWWLALWPEQVLADNPKQYWRPLFNLGLLLDQQLWGLAPGPRHALHLPLAALGGLGLGLWLRGLGCRPLVGLLAAALYTTHPLLGEPVYWLASRDMLLAGAGMLLGLGLLARGIRRRRRGRRGTWWLLAAAACQGAAFMSQEAAVVAIPIWLATLWALRPGRGGIPLWLVRWGAVPVLLTLAWAACRGALFGWDQILDFWNEDIAEQSAGFRPDYSLWYRLGSARAALLPVHWGVEQPWRAVPSALLLLLGTVHGFRAWRRPGLRPRLLPIASLAVLGLLLVLWVPLRPDSLEGSRSALPFAAASAALTAIAIGRLGTAVGARLGQGQRLPGGPWLRSATVAGAALASLLASGWASHHNDSGYARAQGLSKGFHTAVQAALRATGPDGRVFVADIPRLVHGAVFRLAPFGQESIEFGPPLLPSQEGPRLRRFRPGRDDAWLAALAGAGIQAEAGGAQPSRSSDAVLRLDPLAGTLPAWPGEVTGAPWAAGRLRARLDRVAIRHGAPGEVQLHLHWQESPLVSASGGGGLELRPGDFAGEGFPTDSPPLWRLDLPAAGGDLPPTPIPIPVAALPIGSLQLLLVPDQGEPFRLGELRVRTDR